MPFEDPFDEVRRRIVRGELDPPPLPDPLPVLPERVDGGRVIDLRQLEPEQWVSALRLMHRTARYQACDLLGETGHLLRGRAIALPLPRARRPSALDEPAHIAVPEAPARRDRAERSVGFRLPREQHEDLVTIAAGLGMSASALAKAFTVSGLNRAIEERR